MIKDRNVLWIIGEVTAVWLTFAHMGCDWSEISNEIQAAVNWLKLIVFHYSVFTPINYI